MWPAENHRKTENFNPILCTRNCHTQFLYFGLVRFADVCTFWCQDGQSSEAHWDDRICDRFFGFEKAMARGASVFPASCSASIGSTWSEHLRSCRWTWIGLICFSWASFFKAKVASTQQAVEVTVDQNRWTKIWFLVILLNEATPRNSQPWCGVGILWYAKHHRVAGKISSKESALKRIMLFRESRNKSCKWRATFRTRKKLL